MRRRLASLSLVLAITITVSATPLAAFAAQDSPPSPPKGAAVERPEGDALGLIVRYAPGVNPTAGGDVTGAAGVSVQLFTGDDLGRGLRTVEFDEILGAEAALEAAEQLAESPLVLKAYPDFVYRSSETTESVPLPPSIVATQTSATWGLGRIDQTSSSLDYRYIYDTTGQGVTAYIVDSGIRSTHKQFTGRLETGYHLSRFTSSGDCNGHGTHVAGTVGGTTYGVAKMATLIPVRVFGCTDSIQDSPTTSELLGALDWIIADHAAGEPAVANMSFGGPVDTLLDAKVQAVIADGITVVVASGNEGSYSCDSSPARVPNAITVNASTKLNADASYSNLGNCSDLYAPGSAITSADSDSDTDTATFSGTSMASPHVAGVAARILSHYPTLTPTQVTAKILDEATFFDPGLNDYIAYYCSYYPTNEVCSWGQDPEKILFASRLPVFASPPTPTITGSAVGFSTLTATPGSWTQTTSEPDLTYQWKRSGAAIAGATGLEYTLTPADVGSTISFTVTANAQGFSTLSKTSSSTGTVSKPVIGQPQALGVVSGPGTLNLSWIEPASYGGTISDYVVKYRSTSTTKYTTYRDGVSPDLNATISGLKFGSSYYVKVAATTEFGTGPSSSPVLVKTLTGRAVKPTGLLAGATPRSVTLDWTTPSTSNGGTISDYTVRYRVSGATTWKSFADGVSTLTSATVTGLTVSRKYEFAVSAKTQFGSGSSATITRSTLSGLASAPPGLAGTASLTGMELTWNSPSTTNGGGDVTDYRIRYRTKGATTWITVADDVSTSTNHTISGLARNKSYEFAVAAKTTFGTGSSTTIAKSTQSGIASAPTSLTANRAATSLSLSWAAPTTSNGGTITDYVVRYRAAGTTTWKTVADGTSTDTAATITGLTRSRSYDVNIYARTIAGSTGLSGSSTTLRTSTLSGVPAAPTLATIDAGVDSLVVSVTSTADPAYPVTDYSVQYRLEGATTWTTAVESLSGSGGEITITSILEDATYEVRSTATSAAGTSPFSATLKQRTGSSAP